MKVRKIGGWMKREYISIADADNTYQARKTVTLRSGKYA